MHQLYGKHKGIVEIRGRSGLVESKSNAGDSVEDRHLSHPRNEPRRVGNVKTELKVEEKGQKMTTERKEKFTPDEVNFTDYMVEKIAATIRGGEIMGTVKDDSVRRDLERLACLIIAAPEMYGSNEAALDEIDAIIPALLKPCRLCDKIFDGPRICSVCAECDTQRAIHAARTMQRRITNLQKKARGEE